LDEHFVYHMKGQLAANIDLTRQLRKVRQSIEQGDKAQPKARVISLAREPLDWYRAELVQNFAGYMPALRTFCGRPADDDRDDAGCLVEAHRAMLATLTGVVVRSHADIADVLEPALDVAGQRALLRNARNFFKPILWFQRLFEAPTGIDVFGAPGQAAGRGALRFESPWCDALVLRYEDLDRAVAGVAGSVGASGLTLPRATVSDAKPESAPVGQALGQIQLPAAFAQTLYRSAYCRTFGYAYRDRFASPGGLADGSAR
jgi:hypothetical protein